MPKQLKEIKEFLLTARRKDAKSVKIEMNPYNVTKFKVRCSKYLYTIVVTEKEGREAQAVLAPRSPGKDAEERRVAHFEKNML
ncbi:hypothetical protein HPB50_026479 [Hyalomma asiaticum]|uniref:Uncharacterized protein n=1 Tax=Hyalomma asiaticum TaxID=266040 RepID=A0ACB7T016_HYAAI|nr:hypothetical protein HPB50_026479 [Hyalomma asiaticum]